MPNVMKPLIFTIILLIYVQNSVRCDPDTFLEFLDSIGNVPWLVSLSITKGGGHFCDGSLITTWWVLTAAHCVRNFDAADIEVRAGSAHPEKGGWTRLVERMVVHPDWRNDENFNFALLKLDAAFELELNVDVIKLVGADERYAITGQQCVGSGWGLMQGRPVGELHGLIVPLVDPGVCKASCSRCETANILCAGGNGLRTCQGDSGGPLVCSGRLAGIASSGRSCGGQYGLFAFVQSGRKWIAQVAGI